ncbi:hypothetical protein I4U23_001966 [Adineta vaga]|nr:hypothetical protein I4U23_001966 [Adineta vaga]
MYFKIPLYFLLFTTITGDSLFDWEKFKHDYNKQYTSTMEESARKQIFLENVDKIKEFQHTHPDATFTIGINHLTDRRPEELVTGPKISIDTRPQIKGIPIQTRANLPTSLDWRDNGVITPVYDQGQQAKVSSIAAVEVIESYHAIRTKQLIKGSVDQVSRCCSEDTGIFNCILTKLGGGICAESAYNSSSIPCDKDACQAFTEFNKVNRFEPSDEEAMLTLIQESPLYVGIDASIYQDETCSKTEIDHVVQLVGYGMNEDTPYWILKNSWGVNWGNRGYIYLKRGSNTCGIANVVEQIQYINSAAHLFTLNSLSLIFVYFILYFLSNL